MKSIASVQVSLVGEPVRERIWAVAAGLGLRTAEVSADVYRVILREVPQLQGDQRILALLEACVQEDVITLVQVLQHTIDPRLVYASAAAQEYARRLAQRGVPVKILLRAYRIGAARFHEWCMRELPGQAGEPTAVASAALDISRLASEYFDRVCEEVVSAYEQERDNWQRRPSAARAAWVRALLNGEHADGDSSEPSLGYRLSQHHAGLVCWAGDEDGNQEGGTNRACGGVAARLERATAELAAQAGCQGRPMFLPQDQSSAWAWLPLGSQSRLAPDAAAVVAARTAVRFAIGSPAVGAAGFRRTHQQAVSAHAVALAAGPRRQGVTSFEDVAPLAMMLGSMELLRDWVQQTLGSLAGNDVPTSQLRATLRVFLQENGSYQATARRMSVHKNTVQYRVRKAEKHLGGRVDRDRLNLELALLASERLGLAARAPSRRTPGPGPA